MPKTIRTLCEKDGMIYSLAFQGSLRKLNVAQLQRHLHELTGISPSQQDLRYEGTTLNPETSCHDCGIRDDALLVLSSSTTAGTTKAPIIPPPARTPSSSIDYDDGYGGDDLYESVASPAATPEKKGVERGGGGGGGGGGVVRAVQPPQLPPQEVMLQMEEKRREVERQMKEQQQQQDLPQKQIPQHYQSQSQNGRQMDLRQEVEGQQQQRNPQKQIQPQHFPPQSQNQMYQYPSSASIFEDRLQVGGSRFAKEEAARIAREERQQAILRELSQTTFVAGSGGVAAAAAPAGVPPPPPPPPFAFERRPPPQASVATHYIGPTPPLRQGMMLPPPLPQYPSILRDMNREDPEIDCVEEIHSDEEPEFVEVQQISPGGGGGWRGGGGGGGGAPSSRPWLTSPRSEGRCTMHVADAQGRYEDELQWKAAAQKFEETRQQNHLTMQREQEALNLRQAMLQRMGDQVTQELAYLRDKGTCVAEMKGSLHSS